MVGLCDLWATAEDMAECDGAMPTTDEQVLARCLAMASRCCFVLGGNRWPGECSDTVDIFRGGCSCSPIGGASCGLLHLPETPIIAVQQVLVDGAVLDPGAYKIVDNEALIRVDGSTWPSGYLRGDGTTGLQVTYTYGGFPTELGRHAAAVLARELALAICGSNECRLDRRVTSIVREGVSEDLSAAMPGLIDALRDGRIGLPEVDLFVFSENPGNLRRPGRFVVPGSDDLSHRRIR